MSDTKEIVIKAEIPTGAEPRAVVILYRAAGSDQVKIASLVDGGPDAADCASLLLALTEHLSEVVHLGRITGRVN